MNLGTYYLGRVLKLGTLTQDTLIDAINKPKTIYSRGKAWTIVDVFQEKDNKYIFGRLSKFKPEGEITKIDTFSHSEIKQSEANLSISTSPFIYIPEFSGIVFLNVSQHIEKTNFIKKFTSIINETYDNLLVDCQIELITDLRTFSSKLSELDGIYSINAKISPPNPMFGPLWEPLKEYLRNRNTDKMTIIEESPQSEPLNTNLQEFVQKASEQNESNMYSINEELDIGDAAILMAADGYGHANIRGKKGKETIIIKTSESMKSFSYSNNPDITYFYNKSYDMFKEIMLNRHMRH